MVYYIHVYIYICNIRKINATGSHKAATVNKSNSINTVTTYIKSQIRVNTELHNIFE